MSEEKVPFNIDDFAVGKNYVIDASAGTGKTFTIVEIVKKLIENGISLDKMLILTYTDKAAGELKDRIREKCPDADIDNAGIGTIHSFCRNIISEFPVASGQSSQKTLIDEDELKDFLKRYIRKGSIYENICQYEKYNDEIEDKLIKKTAEYVKKYYLDSQNNTDEKIISFHPDIKSTSYLDFSLYNGNILEYPEVAAALDELKNSDEEKAHQLWESITENKNLKFDRRTYKDDKFTAKTKPALDILKNYSEKFNAKNKDKNLSDDFLNKTVFDNIREIYIAWQKEKENLCEQTYNDMIRDVREAVVGDKSELREKIREKYTYAIIDEFQDTNQLQWDIFSKVFLTEGHNIIVVGDPKQSIYSFQGADVYVYKKAIDEIIKAGGENKTLKINYRSSDKVIEAANNFFSCSSALEEGVFQKSDCPDGGSRYRAEYKGSECKAFFITDGKITDKDYAKIVCEKIIDFCTADESGKTNLRVTDEKDKTKMRNVSFRDFAVLSRTKSEIPEIRDAFEKCGIPYFRYKDSSLFQGRECASWIAVIEAVSAADFSGSNIVTFLKAMDTCFFGYSLDEINSRSFPEDFADETVKFESWRKIAAERNWERLIESIIEDTGVASKMSSAIHMKQLGSVFQIGEYAVDFLNKKNSLEMLVKTLRKLMNGSDSDEGDGNENLVAKVTDSDCVQIMTIHASKGLQFPVVISVAGFKLRKPNLTEAYEYHDEDSGNCYLTFDRTENCKNEYKKEMQRLFYVAYTRAKYLLMLPLPHYTKSNDFSFVPDSINNYIDNYPCEKLTDDGSSFENLRKKVQQISASADTDRKSYENTDSDFEKRTQEIKEFTNSLYSHGSHKYAYSSLSHGNAAAETMTDDELKPDNSEEEQETYGLSQYDEHAKPVPCVTDEKSAPVELPKNFPAGTALGTALHSVFEKINYTAADDNDALIEKCFIDEKIRFKTEWLEGIRAMIKNVIGAAMPEIRGSRSTGESFSLSAIAFDDRSNEAEFNFNRENERFNHYFNGFVDLIFRRNGYFSILDWKSDRLNEDFTSYSDNAEMKKHVDGLYSIQRVLYSYCLIKWLRDFYPDKTDEEIFNEHFGGVYYVFLRGCNEGCGNGIYAQTWDSFATLKEAYDKIVKEKVH